MAGPETDLREAGKRLSGLAPMIDGLTELVAALDRLYAKLDSPGKRSARGTIDAQPVHSGQLPEGRPERPSRPQRARERKSVR